MHDVESYRILVEVWKPYVGGDRMTGLEKKSFSFPSREEAETAIRILRAAIDKDVASGCVRVPAALPGRWANCQPGLDDPKGWEIWLQIDIGVNDCVIGILQYRRVLEYVLPLP